MAVQLLDISRQYAYLKDDLKAAVEKVLQHGRFILGPEVTELEAQVAALCGVPHAVGVSSGTDALLVALFAAGVGAGDEVITTDFSFFATAGVIHRLGAKPVLVDIDPDSYNIDPALIEAAITPQTKAIMPVHLFGQPADMDPIMDIAQRHKLVVVEDAAQAIGAEYKGRKAGSIGDYGCFSFYPTKNLGAAGDAGMITMNSPELYEKCRRTRVHGAATKYFHDFVGFNARLDSMQAAVILAKMPHLQSWSEQRVTHAKAYDTAFSGIENIRTPRVDESTTFHIYNQYTISIPNRDDVKARLAEAEIGSMIYYPLPFHRQPCFSYLEHSPSEFPVSTKAAQEVLSLPIYPELTPAERDEVIAAIIKLVE
jgi:dTDP-4-amino-4,6-dideoxygalactose transaminase